MTAKKECMSCGCGWGGECLGLCALLGPLDADILEATANPQSSLFDTTTADDEDISLMVAVASEEDEEDKYTCNKRVLEEHSEETLSTTAATDKGGDVAEVMVSIDTTNLKSGKTPEPSVESRMEIKKNREKARRGSINNGLDQLAELVFMIDPQLKETAARARFCDMLAKVEHHLSRVDLVHIAVATLARVYQENEVHKVFIALCAGEENVSPPKVVPPSILLSSALESPESEATSDASTDSESRMERKRQREKKRRKDVNRGLDTLMELIFIIDPEIKATAEENANSNHGGSKTFKGSDYILSRVELVNHVVNTLVRIHEENEYHKTVLAQIADKTRLELLEAASDENASPRTASKMAILSSLWNMPAATDLAASMTALPNTSLASLGGAKSSPSGTSHSPVATDSTGESSNAVNVQSTISEEAENVALHLSGEILSDAEAGNDEPAKKRLKAA